MVFGERYHDAPAPEGRRCSTRNKSTYKAKENVKKKKKMSNWKIPTFHEMHPAQLQSNFKKVLTYYEILEVVQHIKLVKLFLVEILKKKKKVLKN